MCPCRSRVCAERASRGTGLTRSRRTCSGVTLTLSEGVSAVAFFCLALGDSSCVFCLL